MSGDWIICAGRLCARASNAKQQSSSFSTQHRLVLGASRWFLCWIPIDRDSRARCLPAPFDNPLVGLSEDPLAVLAFHDGRRTHAGSSGRRGCAVLLDAVHSVNARGSSPRRSFQISVRLNDVRARVGIGPLVRVKSRTTRGVAKECYLVDPASSHMLVSKIKPCMCKYELIQTVKLRMAH